MAADRPARTVVSSGAEDLCRPWRRSLFCLGLLFTGLGIAGLILPLMPGTVFLLLALWAFSRSSERLHLWLYHHPRFGRGLRDWHRHRAIPLRAKIAAVAAMALSVVYVATILAESWQLPALVAAILLPVAVWIAAHPNPPRPQT